MMAGLPPGQREIAAFPRFGLPEFAGRAPATGVELHLTLADDSGRPTVVLRSALEVLPRVEQASDLHCVTSWSSRGLRWSGYRFRDFHDRISKRTWAQLNHLAKQWSKPGTAVSPGPSGPMDLVEAGR